MWARRMDLCQEVHPSEVVAEGSFAGISCGDTLACQGQGEPQLASKCQPETHRQTNKVSIMDQPTTDAAPRRTLWLPCRTPDVHCRTPLVLWYFCAFLAKPYQTVVIPT